MQSIVRCAFFAALAVGMSTAALPQERPAPKDFRVAVSVSPFTELTFRQRFRNLGTESNLNH
jgi:hypothetical protein